jgi:hypothetical protein
MRLYDAIGVGPKKTGARAKIINRVLKIKNYI